LYNTRLVNVDALLNHIELNKTAVALVGILDSVQLLLVKTVTARQKLRIEKQLETSQ
jgi:hypothetical protein